MIITDVKPFKGQHCETTATGTLLNQLDISLSEPMLFGLGEGLGYIVWNMKNMDIPFIGGRIKPDILTENLVRNLNLKMQVYETTSIDKAWKMLKNKIDKEIVVGLKLDCYHLDYFSHKFHFAAHYVSMYGYANEMAYLIDTEQQGNFVTTSLVSLARARSEKGPMSSPNRMYTISLGYKDKDINKAILPALHRNATDYLNPPIQNIGYKGIMKTAIEIKKWFKDTNKVNAFITLAMLMEKAGTGGALFRNLFRDFIGEAVQRLGIKKMKEIYQSFCGIAREWSEVSNLFHHAGTTGEVKYINEASGILNNLALLEKEAMIDVINLKM